jgi:hypothetical protein
MDKFVGNARYFETSNPRFDEIKRLLDDNGFKEKMEGMKRLIAVSLFVSCLPFTRSHPFPFPHHKNNSSIR